MILPDFLTRDADGSIHVTGHRIGLEHLVHYYEEGYSPEMLVSEYPSLGLAEIHKIIAFYLENRIEVDAYISKCQEQLDTLRNASHGPSLAELRQRLQTTAGADGL
jgi:uncharacterized protein (DUF433 family)